MTLGEAYAEIDRLHEEGMLTDAARVVMRSWLRWTAVQRVSPPDYVGQFNQTTGGVLVWLLPQPMAVQVVIPCDVDMGYSPKGSANRLIGCHVDISSHQSQKTGCPTLVVSVRFPSQPRSLPV